MTLLTILWQSWDEILSFLNDLHNTGISWGAVITALLLWSKMKRNKRFHERDVRMEAKIDAIMQKVGVECANLTVTEPSAESAKTSSTSLSVVQLVARIARRFINYLTGRKTIMERLKSRKLWAFLGLVLLNGFNDTLGLNMSHDTIKQISDVGVSYIFAQAGVDALKPALSILVAKYLTKGGTQIQPTQLPWDPNANNHSS